MKRAKEIQRVAASPVMKIPDVVKVLIVDDVRIDRATLTRICESMGFATDISDVDSLAAMAGALSADTYDLIFLGLTLPDGTGFQGLDMILSDPDNRIAATIMIAGDSTPDMAAQATHSGCSDFLSKEYMTLPVVQRASINALQKASLAKQILLQETMRYEVEHVLDRFTDQFAQEIKPMLFKMMREVRSLEATRTDKYQHQSTLQQISTACERLFDFMADLGDKDRKALALSDVSAHATSRQTADISDKPLAAVANHDRKERSMAERTSFFNSR